MGRRRHSRVLRHQAQGRRQTGPPGIDTHPRMRNGKDSHLFAERLSVGIAPARRVRTGMVGPWWVAVGHSMIAVGLRDRLWPMRSTATGRLGLGAWVVVVTACLGLRARRPAAAKAPERLHTASRASPSIAPSSQEHRHALIRVPAVEVMDHRRRPPPGNRPGRQWRPP